MKTIDVPESIPIFPLQGAVLFPTGNIPLHIFEPRYCAMVDEALRSSRLIGMIQPKNSGEELYDIGCIGRITSFEELEDGRYIISLTGHSRFKYISDTLTDEGYRLAKICNADFDEDQDVQKCLSLDRERFHSLLETYFGHHDLDYNMDLINEATDHKLITCLSMICPFTPSEKQALLEAKCCKTRAKLFMAMLEIETHNKSCDAMQ